MINRLCVLVLLSLCSAPTLAETLTRTNVTADEVFNAIASGSVEGRITAVTLVKDDGSGILLDVDFEGYEQHDRLELAGQVMKNDRPVGRMVTEDHSLGAPSGRVRLAMTFKAGKNDQALDSDTIVLQVKKKTIRQQFTYHFNKSWVLGGAGPTAVVKIRPKRIGGAPVIYRFSRAMVKMRSQPQQMQTRMVVAQQAPRGQQEKAQHGYIRARQGNSMCFHRKYANYDNGNPVHLWNCSAGQDGGKKWIYEASTGYIRIAGSPNKCIHRKNNNWNNGNPIHLWDCDAGIRESKSWKYDKGTGLIQARYGSGKCIHKKENNWNNGNSLHLWNCNTGQDRMKTWNVTMPGAPAGEPAPQQPWVVATQGFPLGNPTSKEREGPSDIKVDLIEGVDNISFDDLDFLGIEVYADKNEDSGVFYYHPRYYSLDWNPATSDYGMEILYGAGGDEDRVSMGMRLRASYTQQHLGFIGKVLKAQYPNFDRLVPLPGESEVTLPQSLSSLFGVSEDKIVAQTPTLGQVKVEWLTDPVGVETLVAALTNQMGVEGQVRLTPPADLPALPIPMFSHLATRRTFGHVGWDRQKGWENTTDFPIVFEKLHAIKVGENLSVDSWDLSNTQVPASSRVQWQPDDVPSNFSSTYAYAWIEYSVADCPTCATKAAYKILGETEPGHEKTLTINVLTPLSGCGFGAGVLKVRSRYLSPAQSGASTVEHDLTDQSQVTQKLYMGSDANVSPVAEYQITGILQTGQPIQADSWVPIKDQIIYIGSHQVAQMFGDQVDCE